jgi:hypothetical protein
MSQGGLAQGLAEPAHNRAGREGMTRVFEGVLAGEQRRRQNQAVRSDSRNDKRGSPRRGGANGGEVDLHAHRGGGSFGTLNQSNNNIEGD